MGVRAPAMRDGVSANQVAKQREIVEVAMRVLATRGLAACTGRQVAEDGRLTKSVIHYYFADMAVLIDRAMGEHVANFVADLRRAADRSDDPGRCFWNVIDACLSTFRDHPHLTYLWFEYWVDAVRTGRDTAVGALNTAVTAVLAERLDVVNDPDPADTAGDIFVFLLGAILNQATVHDDPSRIRRRVADLAGVPIPTSAPVSGRRPN